MARTANPEAKMIKQCTAGRRIRNIATKSLIVGAARTNNTAPNRVMATAIQGETEVFGLFVAPCACKVTRISVNGTPFIDNNVAETSTVTVTKAVIGGDNVDLCSAITVGDATVPTLDTCLDGTLSTTAGALDLIEGQHVYGTLVVGATVQTAVAYLTVMMEWIPMDAPE